MWTNRLAQESSPYLQQHKNNPVDWYPWGEEAFTAARDQDKPIFLSIGYATCHWCHVMEKETFEDPHLATLMNETFINVKVDREEHPEVDSLYMEFAQAMLGGGGGWPLNLVLTPELKPVFAATYLPPTGTHGMLSMRDVIQRIRELWHGEAREKLFEQAEMIVEAIATPEIEAEEELPSDDLVEGVADLYFQMADPVGGGIQGAPKFPMAYHLNFMLRYAKKQKDSRALFYVEKALDFMQRGGIYDHLGGGFSRYAVDDLWTIPHFEKMLYDNALIARAYIEAWQASKKELHKAVAEATLQYALREMEHDEGGFYSAEDADSEGEEGAFYIWSVKEIREILGNSDAGLFCDFYGCTPEGNFDGKNVLYQRTSVEEFSRERGIDPLVLAEEINQMRAKLFEARSKRERPFKDDKILVGWNGLMIGALAEGYWAFGESTYLEAAKRAADFIHSRMYHEGHLYRRYRNQEAGLAACLEDYAYLISGLLSLYKAGGNPDYLKWAVELSNTLTGSYKQENGGFFRSDGTDANLLVRRAEYYDGAEPSGNAVHAENLLRLYQITGAERYLSEAEDILRSARPFIEGHPLGGTYGAVALQRYLDKEAPTLIVVGDEAPVREALGGRHLPHLEIIWKRGPEVDQLAPIARDKESVEGKTTLYLCRPGRCEEPTTDLEMLRTL